MEDGHHPGSDCAGAGELQLELLEHDPETEGHSVCDHVGEERGGHHHPAEATIRSSVALRVSALATAHTDRHREVGRVL